MRRLPAIGTAVMFFATLAVSAAASADPIKIEAGARSGKPSVRLTPLGTGTPGGFYSSSHRSTGNQEEMSTVDLAEGWGASYTGNQAFVDGSRGSFGGGIGNPAGGGLPAVSARFVASKSSSVVPFDVPSTLTGDTQPAPPPPAPAAPATPAAQPVAGPPAIPQPRPAAGPTVQLPAPAQAANPLSSNGNLLVPSAVAGNFSTPAAAGVSSAASVVTPEPASMLLLGSGLAFAGIGARLRRRKKR